MEENFDWKQISESAEDIPREQIPLENQLKKMLPEPSKQERIKKELHFSSDRIGWATALLVSVWIGLAVLISNAVVVIEHTVGRMLPFSVADFYNEYVLLINEISLGIAIAVAVLVLLPVPQANLENRSVKFSSFLKTLLICFGVGYLGNLIGTFLLSFWNGFTGNSVGDELESVLYDMNPLILFLFSMVLAPILEELFFRKFLIDRLRPFGRTVSVFLPAFLFGLFHQSAEQLPYAFAVGAILSYFYYETGKYWLVVAIHSIFNWVSGFIPLQFLPKINSFANDLIPVMEGISKTATMDEITEQMVPLLETYGTTLALYALYLLILFAINITGVVLFFINIKKFFQEKEDCLLSGAETVKAVILNPGMIVCTVLMSILTIFSLFM